MGLKEEEEEGDESVPSSGTLDESARVALGV
jgi:hypothetical protein